MNSSVSRSLANYFLFFLSIICNLLVLAAGACSSMGMKLPAAAIMTAGTGCAVIFLLFGLISFIKREIRLNRYIDSAWIEGTDASPLPSWHGGPLFEIKARLDHFFNILQRNIVSVKNLWRKDYELSQAILSNSEAISEELRTVSVSGDSLEDTTVLLNEKITESKRTIDDIQKVIEKADHISANQATAMEESSASVDELISSIRNIAGISAEKQAALDRLGGIVERGQSDVNDTIEAFSAIEKKTAAIFDMATIISEVAEQTNLLSMNAAIEAAHAGEHGRGFAVVAEEIKKLAESSRNSASSISGTLKDVRTDIDHMLIISGVLKDSMGRILESVRETTASMEEIIGGMTEMSAGTNQISTALVTLVDTSAESKRQTNHVLEKTSRLQEYLWNIESHAKDNGERVKAISKSVHRISHSLNLLFDISDDNTRTIKKMHEALEMMKTRKRFICDYIPPYQFVENDRITGVFTEVVSLMLSDLGEEGEIEFMSWTDELNIARDQSEVFLFSVLRSAQREKEFQWIGPVVPDEHFLYRLTERTDIAVPAISEIRNYRLGCVANNYAYKYFIDNGAVEENIKTVQIHTMNIQNLLLGEVDIIPLSALQLAYQMKILKRSIEIVTPVFKIDAFPTDAYLAVSLSTPVEVYQKYLESFKRVKKTREYTAILEKYRK